MPISSVMSRDPTAEGADLDPVVEQQVARRRERAVLGLSARSRVSTLAVLAGFVFACCALQVLASSVRMPSALTVVGLVVVYAVASNVKFEVRTTVALPTQLVLVPMLFVLPVEWVPPLVAAGLLLGGLRELTRISVDRALLVAPNAAHSLGPAAVLAIAGQPSVSLHDWPIYVCALASQFAVDGFVQGAHQWYVNGVPPRALVPLMKWAFLVDLALAPIGLALAYMAEREPAAIVLVLPLLALFSEFARERRARLDHVLELSNSYRGTALLLGDVVEADD